MEFLRKILLSILVMGMIVGLVACGNNDSTGEETTDDTEVVENVETEEEETEEEEVEEEEGLVYESSMELDYAENFKVDYYKDGYKIITDAGGRELLLVPEGKEVPELDREMIVKQMPLDRLVIATTVDGCWFDAIDGVDNLVAATYPEENWELESIKTGIQNGDILFIGKTKALDYELLESVEPDLFLVSEATIKKSDLKLDELDIDTFYMGAYLEEDPRGRMEWVKLAGALTDKDEEAIAYYDNELGKIDDVIEKIGDIDDSDRPKVGIIYWSASKQLFRVTNNHGYIPKTTELAGGLHWPQDLNTEERGGTDFSNEDFYSAMEDVDILLYDEGPGKEVKTKEDLLAKAPFVEDLKAFQDDNIFMIKRTLWQAADRTGDVVKELNQIINDPNSPDVDEMEYYYRMK